MGGDSDHTLVAVVAFGFFGLLGLLAFLAARPRPPPAPTTVVYEETERGFVITEKPLRPTTSGGFKLVKLGTEKPLRPTTSGGFKLVKLGSKKEEEIPRFKPVKVGKDEWILVREE